MKAACLGFFLLIAPLVSIAADVAVGDSLESVRSNLGIPRGNLKTGSRDVLYYDRGEVEVRSGVVIRVSLRSEEEQAAFDARRTAEALRAREEREILRARLTAEGEELKARKLADPSFQASPPGYQVAFWEDFSRRYSDVPSAEQLQVVRARLAEQMTDQQAKMEQARRLAELETRVAEAEARSNEALAYRSVNRGFYPYQSSPHDRYPLNLWPINYQLFESPLPYATSPGMPPMQPVYRKDPAPLNYPVKRDEPRRDNSGRSYRMDRDSSGAHGYVPDFGRY